MELPGDIATWLPFGVTVGAIALAAGLALVVLVMRLHTDRLLRRADEKTRAATTMRPVSPSIVIGPLERSPAAMPNSVTRALSHDCVPRPRTTTSAVSAGLPRSMGR